MCSLYKCVLLGLCSACCICWFSHLLILDSDPIFVIRFHQRVQGQHSRLQFTFFALESQGETESFTERYPSCTETVSYSWSCSISLRQGRFLWSCLERKLSVVVSHSRACPKGLHYTMRKCLQMSFQTTADILKLKSFTFLPW